jgi:2-methylfumaryl-CoA isomerase
VSEEHVPPSGSPPLAGVVIIEMATFVAGPSAGMTCAQLGADVVRIDPIGGAVDRNRWPIDEAGHSLFWSSLNRGKRSVALDLRSDAGRDLVIRMICAPGAQRGIVIDNAVSQDWLSWPNLARVRPDVIHVHIEGHRDGSPAVDYTVNAETGVPMITGSADLTGPVNHSLPAWDLLTGMTATTAVLAALRRRDLTGEGARINLALADVALAGVANLGWLSEARRASVERERQGNNIYGSYGRDFVTADGQRVMVVALTPLQWKALVTVTGTIAIMDALEAQHAVDLTADEAVRYRLREPISAAFARWFADRDLITVADELTNGRVLWAAYRSLRDASQTMGGPLQLIDQPGIGEVVTAESPMRWHGLPAVVEPASMLGADTFAALRDLANVSDSELAELLDAGVVGAEIDRTASDEGRPSWQR